MVFTPPEEIQDPKSQVMLAGNSNVRSRGRSSRISSPVRSTLFAGKDMSLFFFHWKVSLEGLPKKNTSEISMGSSKIFRNHPRKTVGSRLDHRPGRWDPSCSPQLMRLAFLPSSLGSLGCEMVMDTAAISILQFFG